MKRIFFNNKRKQRKSIHTPRVNFTKEKILTTLFYILVFRVLANIPAPFININKISENSYVFLNLISGGAFSRLTLMATGVGAYITAKIIMELLTNSFESLHEIYKAPGGKESIDRYSRRLSLLLSCIYSIGYVKLYINSSVDIFYIKNEVFLYILISLYHLVGCLITILIADRIEKKGIGPGISILMYMNIVGRLPFLFTSNSMISESSKIDKIAMVSVFICIMFILIIIFEKSEFRYRLNISKIEAYDNIIYDKKYSYLSFKLNLGGVMPIILSSTFMVFLIYIFNNYGKSILPVDIYSYTKENLTVISYVFSSILIFIFTKMYTDVTVSPLDISERLLLKGASLKDVKFGSNTYKFLKKKLSRINLVGAFYLFVVNLVPSIIFSKANFSFLGSTSIIIVISISCMLVDKMALVKID